MLPGEIENMIIEFYKDLDTVISDDFAVSKFVKTQIL